MTLSVHVGKSPGLYAHVFLTK